MRADTAAPPILLINPLHFTLRHYQQELAQTLRHSGYGSVEIGQTVPGDGVSGAPARARIVLRTLLERSRMGRSVHGRIVIVAWPLFGYFEPVTLLGLARSNRVFIVVHDPLPLSRAYGYSRLARLVFKIAVTKRNIRILYHTEHAQRVGRQAAGITGDVVPHPLLMTFDDQRVGSEVASRPIVRVLGQNKQTRSLAALNLIAEKAGDALTLEIHGRGWPLIAGWQVAEGFISEDEFTSLLSTSDCVVLPYDSFFQSGVAARCLEAGVRVVAPRHEHVAELYGDDWPGIVRDASDWHDAVLRTLAVDTADIRARRATVRGRIQRAWSGCLADSGRGHWPRSEPRLSVT